MDTSKISLDDGTNVLVVDVATVARAMSLTPDHTRFLLRTSQIPGFKVLGHWRVPASYLEAVAAKADGVLDVWAAEHVGSDA